MAGTNKPARPDVGPSIHSDRRATHPPSIQGRPAAAPWPLDSAVGPALRDGTTNDGLPGGAVIRPSTPPRRLR